MAHQFAVIIGSHASRQQHDHACTVDRPPGAATNPFIVFRCESERLQTSAFTFERSSRKLRDAMFWKKVKAYLLMGGVMAVLAYIISVMACGFDYAQCRDDDDSKQRRLLSGLRLLLR